MIRLRQSMLAPWAGVFLGALAWFAHHQVGSNANYWDCSLDRVWLTAGSGLLFGAVAAVGGVISWLARAAPPSSAGRPESRGFAAALGAMAAALFLFAILLQALSGLIVPGCFR